jgi:hypothetical protein
VAIGADLEFAAESARSIAHTVLHVRGAAPGTRVDLERALAPPPSPPLVVMLRRVADRAQRAAPPRPTPPMIALA